MQIVNLNSKAHPLKQQTYIFNLKKRAEFKHYTMSLHSNITCTYI